MMLSYLLVFAIAALSPVILAQEVIDNGDASSGSSFYETGSSGSIPNNGGSSTGEMFESETTSPGNIDGSGGYSSFSYQTSSLANGPITTTTAPRPSGGPVSNSPARTTTTAPFSNIFTTDLMMYGDLSSYVFSGEEDVLNVTDVNELFDLGKNETLTQDDDVNLSNGKAITSYKLYIGKYPLYGGELAVMSDKKQGKEVVGYQLESNIDDIAMPLYNKPEPSVDGSYVLCLAKHKIAAKLSATGASYTKSSTRYIYFDENAGTAVFADDISISNNLDGGEAYRCLVDASNGTVLLQFSGVQSADMVVFPAGNAKGGLRHVGVNKRTDPKTGQCLLTIKGESVQVLNMRNSADDDQAQNVAFDCSVGPNDDVNESKNPILDCYDYLMKVQKCFADKVDFKDLSKVGPDNQLKLYVHYQKNYGNSFWNGLGAFFGDGDPSSTYSFCSSQDTVAHELGHAVVSKFSSMVYTGETGCINEAFADMTSMMVRTCVKGWTDWMVDVNLQKTRGYEAFSKVRNFARPSSNEQQMKRYSEFKADSDPHVCSGIYNHVFYLLSTTRGWDIYKAYRVFFGANRIFWRQTMSMAEGACGVLAYAKILDYSAADRDIIEKMFLRVGVTVAKDCPANQNSLTTKDVRLQSGDTVPMTIITNCQSVDELSGAKGSTHLFKLTLPSGQKIGKLAITLRTIAGDDASDADIFVKIGNLPQSPTDHDLGKTVRGGDSSILVANPKPGDYYIILSGTNQYNNVRLFACGTIENYQVLAKALAKGG